MAAPAHASPASRARALDSRFCLTPDDEVQALAVIGNRLFIGGDFRRIGGEKRVRLAAVDLRSGRLLPWHADVTGRPYDDRGDLTYPSVTAFAVREGTLYVGGILVERFGGQSRAGLAAVDARSARVLPWRADVSGDVHSLAAGTEHLYVSGTFSRLGGRPASGIGAVSLQTGARSPWKPRTRDGFSRALAYSDGAVYLGGRLVEAVDAEKGAPLESFVSPRFNDDVNALTVEEARLYVGGDFSRVGSAERLHLAAFDRNSGRLLAWAPRANAAVHALTATRQTVAVGGTLTSLGGARRFGLVGVDGNTGRLLRWAPRLDGTVTAVAIVGSRLYVGGSFRTVNGQRRSGLAAFELDTLELTSWAPTLAPFDPFFLVAALTGEDETVFVAGEFRSANGEPRKRLAAFDSNSGKLRDWNPALSNVGVRQRSTGRQGVRGRRRKRVHRRRLHPCRRRRRARVRRGRRRKRRDHALVSAPERPLRDQRLAPCR